jgi:hypothetical protein
MDRDRFDVLTRTMATSHSRRKALGRIAAAGVVAAVARLGLQRSAAARCTSDGCYCKTGGNDRCDSWLICCPRSQNIPGPGVCATEDACYYGAACDSNGNACAGYCGWDGPCENCCSGYCNNYGQCDNARCSSVGCACDSGSYGECDAGLTCCSLNTGLYGGPGVCQYGC